MYKKISSIALAVFLTALAVAPTRAQAKKTPFTASVDAPESYRSVREELGDKVANGEVPSFAIAVVKDGKIIWEEGIGWADIEKGNGTNASTRYAVASISKSITAAGIAAFEAKGLIRPDSRISALLGKGWMNGKDVGDITVAQVLNHTSGIPHLHQYEFADSPGSLFDRKAALAKYGFVAAEPGTRFLYTNLGFSVLAAVIEKIGKGGFEAVMSRELFGPLGMKGTTLTDWMGADDAARGYSRGDRPYDYEFRLAPDGGAGFLSTAHDLALYSLFQLGDDVPKGFDGATVAEYVRRKRSSAAFEYDRGWGILHTPKHTFLISDGQMAGSSSAIVLVPEEDLAIVVLCNKTGGPALEAAISISGAAVNGLDKIFGDALEAADTAVSKADKVPFENYTGSVTKNGKKIPVRITFSGEKRVLSLAGKQFELRDAGWDRGALQLIAQTGLDGVDGETSGKRLVFGLWPNGDRLFGVVLEELNDERPRWGVPYKVDLRFLKAK